MTVFCLVQNCLYCFSFSLQAYELSTLTGTQVMLLVASETGHVYTFATPKLQPMITSEAGKALIQTCLHTPDPPPQATEYDIRMSATGYEETELGYGLSDEEAFKVCQEFHDINVVVVTREDCMYTTNFINVLYMAFSS